MTDFQNDFTEIEQEETERTRCWCGAFAEHTPGGIDCDSCGDEIDADADLRPSGYEWTGDRWEPADTDKQLEADN